MKKQSSQIVYSKIFLLSLAFIMVILNSFIVVAFEWDNVKIYDNQTQTVTIKNALGLGDTIATAKLLTPHYNKVPIGNNIQVAQINITNVAAYQNFFEEMQFYDTSGNNLKEVQKAFKYKYLTYELDERDVYDYNTCLDYHVGTTYCKTYKKTGTEWYKKELWEDFLGAELSNGTYTIGIFVNEVKKDEVIEWIPTFAGIRIEEWAIYAADPQFIAYYSFSEGAGTTAANSVNSNSFKLGATGTANWTTGILDNAYSSDGAGTKYMSNASLAGIVSSGFSVSQWARFNKWTTSATTERITTLTDGASYGYGLEKTSGATTMTLWAKGSSWVSSVSPALVPGKWYHFVLVFNSTHQSLYVNGTLVDFDANVLTSFSSGGFGVTCNPTAGCAASTNLNGTVDEVGIWNRTLTQAEITELYNNGLAFSPFGIVNNVTAPSITYTEVNNTFQTTSAVYSNVSVFTFNSPYTTNTTSWIAISLVNENTGTTASVGQWRVLLNNVEVANISRTLNAQSYGSTMIVTNPIIITNNSANTYVLQHRRTSGVGTSVVRTINVSSTILFMKDSLNQTINHSNFGVSDTSNSPTYQLLTSKTFSNNTYNGTLTFVYDFELTKTTTGLVEYYINVNQSGTNFNCSTIGRSINDGSTANVGGVCAVQGLNNNTQFLINLFARSSAGSTTFNGKINAWVTQANPVAFNYTQFNARNFSTPWQNIINLTLNLTGTVTKNIRILGSWSINNSNAQTSTWQYRVFNSSNVLVGTSLVNLRSESAGSTGVKILQGVIGNLSATASPYRVELWANSTAATPYFMSGSILTHEVSDIAATNIPQPDVDAPNIVLNLPIDSATIIVRTTNYSANITDGSNIANATLNIWNASGQINRTNIVYGSSSSVFPSLNVSLSDGSYTWWYESSDTSSNLRKSENRTVTIAASGAGLFYGTGTPTSGSGTANSNFSINLTAGVPSQFANATVYVYYSNRTLLNQTFHTTQPIYLTYTGLSSGTYFFNATSMSLNNEMQTLDTRNITVDVTAPTVSIVYPISGANYSATTWVAQLNYTANDNNALDKCWYSINGGANILINCGTNATGLNVSDGYVYYTVYANDTAGNIGSTTVAFNKDTTYPLITLLTPNDTKSISNQLYLSYLVNDTNNYNSSLKIYNSANSLVQQNITLLDNTLIGLCYQETSNNANANDGSCGLNYTGGYSGSALDIKHYDANWLTTTSSSLGSGDFIVNYTKPTKLISNAVWEINVFPYGYVNNTIPGACLQNNVVSLKFIFSEVNGVYCFNSSGTYQWFGNNLNSGLLYEEAIIWNTTNLYNINTSVYLPDGSYSWNVTAVDTYTNVNSSTTRIFLIDTTPPVVSVSYPTSFIPDLVAGYNLTLNFSASDLSINTCWFNYNGVNTTIPCNNNASFLYVLGKNNLTLYANDTVGFVSSAVAIWSAGVLLGNVSYQLSNFETNSSTFTINYTLDNIFSSLAVFEYNGTRYNGVVNCSGNLCTATKTIDLPTILNASMQTNFFRWNITAYNGTAVTYKNSSYYPQNVSRIFLTQCLSGNRTINFTAYDEQNLTSINPFAFDGSFNIYLGNGTTYRNFNYTNTSTNEVDLCISPTHQYYIDAIIAYNAPESGTSYPLRNWFYQKKIINSNVQNVSLLLLRSSSSTSFILKVLDQYSLPVKSILVEAIKCYPGTNTEKTAFISRTDTNGLTVGNFEAETALYKFNLSNYSQTLLYIDSCSKVVPQTTPYTLAFNIGTGYTSSFINIDNATDITSTLTYNKTSKFVTFSYVDTSNKFSSASLIVYEANKSGDTQIPICTQTSGLSSSVLTCEVDEGGLYYVDALVYRTDGSLMDYLTFDVKSTPDVVGKYGVFLAWFIILIAAFMFKFNEIAGIWLTNAAILLVDIVGLVDFGPTFITSSILVGLILTVVLER